MLDYGIHFGLDEDTYHSEPCLSASGLKTLLVSAKDFWDKSWMNPEPPEEKEKAHLDFGKAVHSYILEPETIGKYVTEFTGDDDSIKTVDDMKKWLNGNAIKFKSAAKKADLMQMIMDADPEAPIFDLQQRDYNLANADKFMLPQEDYDKLEIMEQLVSEEKDFLQYFQDGMAEVSFIWECPVTGVRMKSRFDYLALHMADLKTFSRKSGKPIDKVVKDEFLNYRYDIQWYTYSLARDIVYQAIKEGRYKAHGDHNPEWLEYLISNSNDRFAFGFIESSRPFNARVLEIEKWRVPGKEPNMLFEKAENSYLEAIKKFEHCMKVFGPDKPWRDEKIILQMTDKDVPMYFFEN